MPTPSPSKLVGDVPSGPASHARRIAPRSSAVSARRTRARRTTPLFSDRSGVECTVDAQAEAAPVLHLPTRQVLPARGSRKTVRRSRRGRARPASGSTTASIRRRRTARSRELVAVPVHAGRCGGLGERAGVGGLPLQRERSAGIYAASQPRRGACREDGGSLRDPSSASSVYPGSEPRSRAGSGPAASTSSSGRAIRRSRRSRCGRSIRRSRSCSRQIATSMRTSLQRPTGDSG